MRGMIEMHCHILPRVDDGAVSEKMALDMIRDEKRQGVEHIILTPHYRQGMFETDQSTIVRRFERLQELNAHKRTGVTLHLGCEFHRSSNMLQMLQSGRKPSLAGSQYVLTEFSHRDDYSKIRKTVYDLSINGWIPIIAHGERCPSLVQDLDQVEEVRRLGAKLQLTTSAIYGKHGLRMQWICKKLMAEDLVDFVASDAHDRQKRAPDFDRCIQYIEKKKGASYARRLLVHNPGMILAERI